MPPRGLQRTSCRIYAVMLARISGEPVQTPATIAALWLSFRDWLRRARRKQSACAATACKAFVPCIE